MNASLRKEPSPHQPLPECYLVDLERYYDALKLRDLPRGSWKLGGSLLQRQVIFKTLMFHFKCNLIYRCFSTKNAFMWRRWRGGIRGEVKGGGVTRRRRWNTDWCNHICILKTNFSSLFSWIIPNVWINLKMTRTCQGRWSNQHPVQYLICHLDELQTMVNWKDLLWGGFTNYWSLTCSSLIFLPREPATRRVEALVLTREVWLACSSTHSSASAWPRMPLMRYTGNEFKVDPFNLRLKS